MLAEIRAELAALPLTKKALRSFGLVVGGVLALIAVFLYWRNGWTLTPVSTTLGGVGLALIALGLLVPLVLRSVYRVWMGLALVLGYIMTRVLLSIVYLFVVTPIGLLLRLFGKDLLDERLDPAAASYWKPKTYMIDAPERLEKYY